MARTKGTVVENNFIGGLNTEANALAFPPNACTETFNCIFDEFGRITRRPEIDIEKDAKYVPSSPSEYNNRQILTEYLWVNAGGSGLVNLYVVQVGSELFFFDVSTTTNVSNNQIVDYIDLDSFTATDTIYDPRDEPCQYTNGNGYLIVTNRACDPALVTYDSTSTSPISGTRITVKYRDFQGLPSPYGDKQRPSFATISAMKSDTNGAVHFYNLLNQGWHQGGATGGSPHPTLSALGLWDAAAGAASGVMPSNSDFIGYFRSSESNPFDLNRVGANDQGNTLSPKGHFILSLGNPDRTQVLDDNGYTLTYTSTTASLMSGASGTTIGAGADGGSVYANVFDGDSSTGIEENVLYTTGGSKTQAFFAGKDYGGSPIRVNKVIVRPLNNSFGFARHVSLAAYENMTLTMELRGHSSAPSSGSEGTLLGSKVLTINSGLGQSQHTIASSNVSTLYRYVWVHMTATFTVQPFIDTNGAVYLGDLLIYQNATVSGATANLPDSETTIERPTACAFFAGRAWYAGVNSVELSTKLYYSQIIEDKTQYGKCYQANDPTSEFNANVLPTDGGVIGIPEIGRVVKLYAYQSALLIFAANGVWVIQGSDFGASFEPTSFVVKKISSLGTQSPLSFIDVEGLPMWWGEDGIYNMEYNPQFNSFSVGILSEDTIQTFFDSIPPRSRANVKGAYDSKEKRAYWLFRNDDISQVTTPNEYNRVLLLNVKTKAFFPWSFTTASLTPQIKGIGYVVDATGFDTGAIKFSISVPKSGSTHLVTFADLNKEIKEYTDFKDFSEGIHGTVTDAKDFSSYFVTGYRLDAEANKFFQSVYVLLYLKVETDSAAYLQGIFDFANTGQSGDWSTRQEASKQQVYSLDNVERDFHARRLKIRGRGRALQFRVTSQSGKPFTIIGWSNAQSGNADV